MLNVGERLSLPLVGFVLGVPWGCAGDYSL
jgi:hypothetical protein